MLGFSEFLIEAPVIGPHWLSMFNHRYEAVIKNLSRLAQMRVPGAGQIAGYLNRFDLLRQEMLDSINVSSMHRSELDLVIKDMDDLALIIRSLAVTKTAPPEHIQEYITKLAALKADVNAAGSNLVKIKKEVATTIKVPPKPKPAAKPKPASTAHTIIPNTPDWWARKLRMTKTHSEIDRLLAELPKLDRKTVVVIANEFVGTKLSATKTLALQQISSKLMKQSGPLSV